MGSNDMLCGSGKEKRKTMLVEGMDLWRLFDIIGTIAFAVSGALVGLSRRMDIFGISVLALATAVGGGMVRDLLVGLSPPMALRDTTDFLLAVGVAFATSVLYQWSGLRRMRRRRLRTIFNVSDAIGLAAFTITGALTGLRFGGTGSYVLTVLLAVTTAVGGGMIRDVLAKRMPVVLYAEVYAAASLAGAFVFCVMGGAIGVEAVSWLAFLLVLLIRFAAIHWNWSLYHPHPPKCHREHEAEREWTDMRQ